MRNLPQYVSGRVVLMGDAVSEPSIATVGARN